MSALVDRRNRAVKVDWSSISLVEQTAPEEVEVRRVVGLVVLGQAEAELPEVGALVGEEAVERVVEHRRYQLPHEQRSIFVYDVCTG